MAIAEAVAEKLRGGAMFASVEAVKPGFLNLTLAGDSLTAYLARMVREPNFGVSPDPRPRTVVLDYGGPNVAKPLHVGHLRSAIIGESIKRIYRFFGNKVVGDIHMTGLAEFQLIVREGAFSAKRHIEAGMAADREDHRFFIAVFDAQRDGQLRVRDTIGDRKDEAEGILRKRLFA